MATGVVHRSILFSREIPAASMWQETRTRNNVAENERAALRWKLDDRALVSFYHHIRAELERLVARNNQVPNFSSV